MACVLYNYPFFFFLLLFFFCFASKRARQSSSERVSGSVFFGTVNKEARSLARRSWILVGLSGCASALGVSGWYLALNITPVVVVAPIVAVYPLITIAIASLFLRGIEKVTRQTVIGAIIVVTGVLFIGFGTQ